MNLFARKDLDSLLVEAEGEKSGLRRALGALNLTTLGIGAIIGTGIFVLTGTAAATAAGPAVVLSFIIAAIASAFAGLCYAEFSALIPIAGSAYTYSYTTLGEIVAWVIGWALILEYAFGAATVASGWSGYLVSLLQSFGINVPPAFAGPPHTDLVFYQGRWQDAASLSSSVLPGLPHHAGAFNLVAFIGIAIVTTVLVIGIKESANVNNAIVIIKIAVLLVFLGLGISFMSGHLSATTANWHPFIPANRGRFGDFGWSGVFRGAGLIFFAYIGFDAVSTAAQEARHPQRDMPVGILGSLAICTVLYILVAGVLTALVPYAQLNVPDPVAVGADATGVAWGALLVKIGAVCGLGSTMLVMLLGQSRIFFTMSSDGLLWRWASRVHARFHTPYVSTILVGVAVATISGLLPVTRLAELTNIGTLFAFVIVCLGVWVLRVREPGRPRPFRTPLVPLVPILGAVIAASLMYSLHGLTWAVFLIWLGIGLVVYFSYSRYHSRVQQGRSAPAAAKPGH